MDEIRFNLPAKSKESQPTKEYIKKRFIWFLILIAVLGLGIVGFVFRSPLFNLFAGKTTVYNAVFLSNGQVYFGKILKKTSEEVILGEVFYLQAEKQGANATSTESKVTLVKLGQELHGPTNQLQINRPQVLFIEELRDDSKVAQMMREQK